MDYKSIYDQLIERAKTREELQGYTERHHIIPISIGGPNESSNIVVLTGREHFIAHWILVKLYPTNSSIIYAFWMMSCRFKQYSSRAYQEAKEMHILNHTGFKHSDETKRHISEIRKKQGNNWKGKHHTEEAKENISFWRKNENRIVNPVTEKHRRDGISKSSLGKKKSETHRANIAAAKMGEKNPQFGKPHKRIICEKCGFNTSSNNFSRHVCGKINWRHKLKDNKAL